jgi:hypothetical protein
MLHDKKISKSSVKTHGIETEPLTEAEKLTLLRNYDDRDPANKYLSRAWLRKKREYLIRNWDRLRKPKEPISFRERIERYMDACPAAISGQNGHDQTFRVACILVQGFDLSPEDAFSFLSRYNQRCQPQWSEKELRHKLSDADRAQSNKPRGYLL